MSTGPAPLADRLRALLRAQPSLREKQMFGVRAFMVNEKLLVGAGGDGSLLVRADPERHRELLGRPGARQAEMGVGRSMGPSWIRVDPDSVATEAELRWWVAVAEEYSAQLRGRGRHPSGTSPAGPPWP